MKTDDLRGIWNTPENADHRIFGVFDFNEGGSSLKLNGNFDIEDDVLIELIHGWDFNGNKITIFDSWLVDVEYFAELDCVTYFQSYSIIGGHYDSRDELRIKELDFEFSELYSWLESDISLERSSKGFTITNPPDNYKDICLDFGRLEVYFECINNSMHNEINIQWKPRIKLIFSDSFTFNESISILDKLTRYFEFVTGKFISVNRIKCKDLDASELLILIGETINTSRNNYRDITLSYSQLERNLEVSLNNWFIIYDDYMPIISIYLHDYRFMDKKRFLDLIRAVESMARLKSIGQGKFEQLLKLEKNKLNSILYKITNKNERDWLESKVLFLGEPNLRVRLIEIIKNIPGLELSSRKQKSVINKMIETRNYLVHLDLVKKDKCLEKYFAVNYILELVIFLELAELLEIKNLIVEHKEIIEEKIKIIETYLKKELDI